MAQGRVVLALILTITLLLAFYTATAGFSTALEFVQKSGRKLPMLSGPLGQLSQLVPAGTGYGYYAPQVCSEFRIQMRLGNTNTRSVRNATMRLGPEAELLVSSLSSSTQNDSMAKAVAGTFASYGFTQNQDMDAAEVRIEAELMPPIMFATQRKPEWVALKTYYFKR